MSDNTNLSYVLGTLSKLRKEYQASLDSAKTTQDRCTASLSEAQTLVDISLEDLNARIKKVTAFSHIATSHTPVRSDPAEPRPYDLTLLSKLALQVNRKSSNDPGAKKLWLEARGQLLGLIQEKESIENSGSQIASSMTHRREKEAEFLQMKCEKLESDLNFFLMSEEFSQLADDCLNAASVFTAHTAPAQNPFGDQLMIGYQSIPLNLPESWLTHISKAATDLLDYHANALRLPSFSNSSNGSVLFVEYTDPYENLLLDGVRNMILNILRFQGNVLESVDYLDPVRLDNSALGVLAPLCLQSTGILSPVPNSPEKLREHVSLLLEECTDRASSQSSALDYATRFVFLHNFPQGYDTQTIAKIRQLCANAKHYGLTLVISHNCNQKTYFAEDTISMIRTSAQRITCDENGYTRALPGTDRTVPFTWLSAPSTLSTNLIQCFSARKQADHSNDYAQRCGIAPMPYNKGNRSIKGIPYGVDANGKILHLDFENSNFATFISGASRSGKSTLLHTIITGILRKYHPDDIEMWLVDFKMTEFSRYITHTPPHVRYILLDESPELVYDLLDRLSEILTKRQNIFKGNWQKLDEVPPEKYMPAMFIIIDEFSVMSQIVSDSASNGKEDYRVKLQMLLAKGAALGMHFIFSSQGFTSGTRGLNDFSKKQIQQRIAMKTEYNEIKETLDLKTISDADRNLMEQLTVHHALVRVPMDKKGNHLVQAKVLYLSDYTEQEQLIDRLNAGLSPVSRFRPDDPLSFIDKRTLIIDGGRFHSFEEGRPAIEANLAKQDVFADSLLVYLGEPRRMMDSYPIEFTSSFCENLLVVASANEKMPAASLILTMRRSLQLQHRDLEVWAESRDVVFRTVASAAGQSRLKVTRDLDLICQQISSLRRCIEQGMPTDRCIVLLGFETIFQDMSFMHNAPGNTSQSISPLGLERRKPGTPGLLAQLDALAADLSTPPAAPALKLEPTFAEDAGSVNAYDAREDLKFLLSRGPKYGLHFVMVFKSAVDLGQTRLDPSLFRHKVLFAMPKTDALTLAGSAGSSTVSELSEHSFRYTNGLDSVTFRPYLHEGVSWDGWELNDDGVSNSSSDEDYLL